LLNISKETFFGVEIPTPSSAEQQKIAECLSSVDEVIAAQARKLDALKTHKKGLMQQLFPREGETQPRRRFPEFQKAPEWSFVPLGQLLSGKPEYGLNAPAASYSENLPTYLRITDISDDGRFISDSKASVDIDATEENYLHEGDIVVARTGGTVGKSYRYRREDGRFVFAGFLIRMKPDPVKLDSVFLSGFLNTTQYWDWVRIESVRGGQPGINSTQYASLLIPIPPAHERRDGLSEQQRIADCLSSLDDLIAAETQKLEALKIHKRGLMQQLFPKAEFNQ
jgi:type I restriction enzyme S subunit